MLLSGMFMNSYSFFNAQNAGFLLQRLRNLIAIFFYPLKIKDNGFKKMVLKLTFKPMFESKHGEKRRKWGTIDYKSKCNIKVKMLLNNIIKKQEIRKRCYSEVF